MLVIDNDTIENFVREGPPDPEPGYVDKKKSTRQDRDEKDRRLDIAVEPNP